MVVLPLLQVPPPAPVRVVVWPWHTVVIPVIGSGSGFTVIIMLAVQPVARVYTIVEVPALIPLTTPEVIPMVAAVVIVLVHAPPADGSLSSVVWPTHTLVLPVTGAGTGLTVIL